MKKVILFALLALAIQTQTQAQCNTYYGVQVCNDGDIPSFAITSTSDGYNVTYDPTGVDFTTLGAHPAQINDLDHNLCNCIAPVSEYGYCGSDKGVSHLSYTCTMAPYVYNLWVDPARASTTVNLQLVLFMGITPDGARHLRFHTFQVDYKPNGTPPASSSSAPVKGNGKPPKGNSPGK